MKVQIDRDDCISCTACWQECPEVFEEDADGFSAVLQRYRIDDDPGQGEIPADLGDCARRAAGGCPVEIIHVD